VCQTHRHRDEQKLIVLLKRELSYSVQMLRGEGESPELSRTRNCQHSTRLWMQLGLKLTKLVKRLI